MHAETMFKDEIERTAKRQEELERVHLEWQRDNPIPEEFRQLSEKAKKEYLEQHNENFRLHLQKNHPELLNIRLSRAAVIDLAAGQRAKATEKITTIIEQEKILFTIRDDNNPEMWMYHEGVYIRNGRTYVRERIRYILDEAYTTNLANQVLAKVEADTYIEEKEFFEEQGIQQVCVANGVLNIFTGELSAHDPKKVFFSKMPVTYKPGVDCPAIKKHLRTVLKNGDEDLEVLQELFGFLLLREYRYEKAFMFTGSGRNGKGKTVELMKRFLGIENVSGISLQQLDEDPFAISELHHKLANIGADISSDSLKDTGNFKALTGRDMISANRKFQNRINFTNYAKMIFCANKLPITYDITTAFFNRWILLEFPYTFYKQSEYDSLPEKERSFAKVADPEIIDKLSTDEELSGLLNWALEGLKRLVEQKDFSNSRTTKETKVLWIRKSDSFQAFLMDCVEESWESHITKEDLRRTYAHYCRENKLDVAPDKAIKRVLATVYGAGEDRLSGGDRAYIWKGIKFKKGLEPTHEPEQKSVISNKYKDLPPSKRNHLERLQDIISTEDDGAGVTFDIIESFFAESPGFTGERLEELIAQAVQLGDLFEPKPGRYKLL